MEFSQAKKRIRERYFDQANDRERLNDPHPAFVYHLTKKTFNVFSRTGNKLSYYRSKTCLEQVLETSTQ